MSHEAELDKIDAEAAVLVDGWTDITQRGGVYYGMPRHGLQRVVIGYSRDLRRAMQLVRRAIRFHGAAQNDAVATLTISNGDVCVTTWNPSTGDSYAASAERTDEIPELLVRASLHLSKKKAKAKSKSK